MLVQTYKAGVRLCAVTAAVLFAACSAGGFSSAPVARDGTNTFGSDHLPHARTLSSSVYGREAPDAAKKGIYVSAYDDTSILGYPPHRKKIRKKGPCTIAGVQQVNGIAVDEMGNLVVPEGNPSGAGGSVSPGSIVVFGGPGMCGSEVATIDDPYGQPIDAATRDALNGTIAVANEYDVDSAPGSISLCTVAGGCTVNLTNPDLVTVASVAMDKDGNCWADAMHLDGPFFVVTLTYFAQCTGQGQEATGFSETRFGGLEIDGNGNLLVLDSNSIAPSLTVYSGCKPACNKVGGPFALHGGASYGRLNATGKRLVTADYFYGQVDSYRYTPTSLTYEYSFKKDLSAASDVNGIAFNPRLK